jgi:predicted SAM-dependent methyltransferase
MLSETSKSELRREKEGFFKKYISGEGIDIGCGRLYEYGELDKIYPSAFPHDKDDCDAHTMEIFKDENFDYVYASHTLEHLEDPVLAIKNWYRICKTNGFIIIAVPCKYKYEKKKELPSRWNPDHKRFYNVASLAAEISDALDCYSYKIEYIKDCDEGFDWSIIPSEHSIGEYQIECVIRKQKKPNWINLV